MKYPDESVLIMDNGLFVSLAVTLAKDFGKVWYSKPTMGEAFPTSNSMLVGKGLPGVEVPNDYHDVLDKASLIVCPDVYFAGFQRYMERLGKRVWGARRAEELELERLATKRFMEELGIPVVPYESVIGLDALWDYLKTHKDRWVKISKTRGDVETFPSLNFTLIEGELNRLSSVLGAKQKKMEFVVEENLKDTIELAIDWYTVDGQIPESGMVGIEAKNKSYMGVWEDRDEMLPELLKPYELLAPALEKYRCRSWLAFETRFNKKGKAFVQDPCVRFGSPPGEVVQLQYTNIAEIIREGADGNLVEPIPAAKYAVQLQIHSDWAADQWLPVQFPEEIADNVKLKNATCIDGQYYVVPQANRGKDVGAICATDDTLKGAIKKVKACAEQVEGSYLDIFPDSLDGIQEGIDTIAEEYGIELA